MKVKQYAYEPISIDRVNSSTDDDGRRFYHTPMGDMPSITTVLSDTADKTYLKEWRERIGSEEADKITRYSSKRGTLFHQECEKIVTGQSALMTPLVRQVYNSFLRYVDVVRATEIPLWSKVLGVAGTCDLICTYKGVPYIVDYKTSNKPKKKEWILDYFLQLCFYSYALEDLTNIRIPNTMVVIAVEQSTKSQLFPVKRNDYKEELFRRIQKW